MTALQAEIQLNNLKSTTPYRFAEDFPPDFHPENLIFSFSAVVLRLESSIKKPIGDDNVLLAPLCDGIEAVFRLGLKSK